MSESASPPRAVSTHLAVDRVAVSDRPLPFPRADGDEAATLRVRERTYQGLAPPEAASVVHDVDNWPFPGRFRILQLDRDFWIEDEVWRIHFPAGSGEIAFGENPAAERDARFDLLAERVLLPLYRLISDDALLAMHGSAVVHGGMAWVFIGDSGAGKSTTTRELLGRGARLLSDDLTLIDVPATQAIPGAPVIRLIDPPDDSGFAMEERRVFAGGRKHWVRLADHLGCTRPAQLGGLIWLNPSGAHEGFEIERLAGQEAFQKAMAQCFDLSNPEQSWRVRRFKLMAALLRDVAIYQYSYAKSESGEPTHVESLLEWLEHHARESRGASQ